MPPLPHFRKIYVEIGNVCNLQCSFCPEVKRQKLRMEKERFREILLQVKPFTDRVCFHLMGEPLSHPEFPSLVEVASEAGTPVEITTNGTLLTPINQAALLFPIVHQVNFSLQSFLDNFPKADPHAYLEKILGFIRNALDKRPDLYLNFRLWNLEEGEGKDLRNENLLKEIETALALSINRRVEPGLRKSKRLLGRLYIHYDTRFTWPDQSQSSDLRTKGTCQGTRTHLGILADGTVVPCCLDKEAAMPLGSLGTESFIDVISGSRFKNIREGFELGELRESFCQRCQYSERFG